MNEKLFQDWHMKPIIILPPDTVSEADIATLRENNLCVVVATDPAKVKFVDPIPSAANRTKIEQAAIDLSRKIMNSCPWPNIRGDICGMFVDLLTCGTPLDKHPTQQEMEQRVYDDERLAEMRRIAREDAKAERAAKKGAK